MAVFVFGLLVAVRSGGSGGDYLPDSASRNSPHLHRGMVNE